ncbi:MAG: hypothetical protein NTU97_00705 [Candidatus Magasanikbacteria bacterium]|nr:hypothetical protein [Candidatus Magasanikbacteria bacterium]
MTAFREGQYDPHEGQIDSNLVDLLLAKYDELRVKGDDFLTARSKSLRQVGIPGDKWRDFSSALSVRLNQRREARGIKRGRPSSKKDVAPGLNPRILADMKKTVDQRGGDPDDLDAE